MFGQDKIGLRSKTLPMVPLRDVVVFPHMMIPFVIGQAQLHQGARLRPR